MLVNCSLSLRLSAAEDIEFIPNIKSANPTIIVPTVRFLSDFVNIARMIPKIARTVVKVFTLKICDRIASLPSPTDERLTNHAVAVVPIFAPIMTPITCDSFISPEFTKPTIITVVAAED